jgi:predicted N-acetyltransferase YhbS
MFLVHHATSACSLSREALLDDIMGEARFTKTAARLRDGRLAANGLSFVARTRTRVIGSVQLWNVSAGPGRPALLLGPLAVASDHRKLGVGTALVHRALSEARQRGHRIVLLVGDAAFYGRFGFSSETTQGLWLPGPYERHRLLGLELVPDALKGAHGLVEATGRPLAERKVSACAADFGSAESVSGPRRSKTSLVPCG